MKYLLLLFFITNIAQAIDLGINVHVPVSQDVINTLKTRNIKSVRLDVNYDTNVATFRNTLSTYKVNNIGTEVILHPSIEWNHTCPQDLTNVQSTAYSQTYAMVDAYKDLNWDYELMNEVTHRSELKLEVPNNTGTTESVYFNKPCYNTISAALKGMSQAIQTIKTASGYPLRTIVGTTGKDYGYIDYVKNQGIVVDVVGYHVYPGYSGASLSTDVWYGPSGLFTSLAKWNLPVKVNEYDCAEIYGVYDNLQDSVDTKNCLKSIKKHLPSFLLQTTAKIESISVYELTDEPLKPSPENKFGLMYNTHTPKLQLALISGIMGGDINLAEKSKLLSFGIITCNELANFKLRAMFQPLTTSVYNPSTCN